MTLMGRTLRLYTDGAIGDGRGGSGLGAVLRDANGRVLCTASVSAGRMTCNEAEYAALVFGLRHALRARPARLQIYLDSQVVIAQLTGRADVRSPRLKHWYEQAHELLRAAGAVSFEYIPREENRLADALAVEALQAGRRRARPGPR